MVKKLFCTALTVLLLLLFVGAAIADRPAVVDDAGMFRASDIAEMEQIIQNLRDRYQVDAVVLTTTETPRTSDERRLADWADRYYQDNGYGLGEDRAGFIFMIDMNNRYPYLSTAGVMIDYLTQDRIEECHDAAYDDLHAGRYGRGAIALLNKVTDYMRKGIEEGAFRYDLETGERLTGLYNKLTGAELVMALAAGLAVALIIVSVTSAAYRLRGKTYRYDRENNADIRFTRDDEQFLRQHVTRTRNDTSGGGGGGHGGGGSAVHRSSGGMTHGGGGGRHF